MSAPETRDPAGLRLSDSLEALWAVLASNFHSTSDHDAFIDGCVAEGELEEALRRYEAERRRRPRDPLARCLVERLRAFAEMRASG